MMDSIRETAHDLTALELVLVVDEDDRESVEFAYDGLNWQRVVVPPDQTMGNLNLAGYKASSGRHLMLLNDDVEARTSGWDLQLRQLLEGYTDGVILAHVNDLLFRDRLCTFPCLTREFCELAGGICPPGYQRYRIDDHLHHVFDLLYLAGYARRVFLPDVIFEHRHGVPNPAGHLEYAPDPSIHSLDTAVFEELARQRWDLALKCLERIEGSLSAGSIRARQHIFEESGDPIALRRRQHARWWRAGDPVENARIELSIVTGDANAGASIQAAAAAAWPGIPAGIVARHNDALIGCKADYVLVLEPGVEVEPGWMEAGLSAISRAGVVAGEQHAVAIDVPRFGHLRFEPNHPNPIAGFLETAREAGATVVAWPAPGPRGPESRIAGRVVPPASRSLRHRLTLRALNAPARIAAQWPLFERLGMGIPRALFDEQWYRSNYPDAVSGPESALLHYLERGGFEGFKPNLHFDSQWYLSTNPDVASMGLNPLLHFVRYGAREGRDPNLFFDVHYYAKENPEAAAGMNPLEHFIATGMKQGRSPCASLTLPEYLARIRPRQRSARVEVRDPVPLSVIIPTHNRRQQLTRTLEACRRWSGGCELDFTVIDDGSEDGTPQVLRQLAAEMSNLRWQSTSPEGPAAARNLGASQARHNVLLFLGDDILPTSHDFFQVHARRHAENPQSDFAVLGSVAWPDDPAFPMNFTMRHLEKDGSQFAFGRLTPETLVGWRYFYTANLSLKKGRIRDWTRNGFDGGFAGAGLEDVELAYRLWQSSEGVRIYYDPRSAGLHNHPFTLETFLDRQRFIGRSLRRLLALHPELIDDYEARAVDAALNDSRHPPQADSAAILIRELQCYGFALEARGELGAEDWHGPFLSALFEMCLLEGYVSTWVHQNRNVGAAQDAIIKRFFTRMRRTSNGFNWPREVKAASRLR
jgi:glycosyltransferase involved in cell wall biosynthesis